MNPVGIAWYSKPHFILSSLPTNPNFSLVMDNDTEVFAEPDLAFLSPCFGCTNSSSQCASPPLPHLSLWQLISKSSAQTSCLHE